MSSADRTSHEWVDTHGHLFLVDDEPEVVLDRAGVAGVAWVMSPGVDVASSEESRLISERFPDRVLWSAGLHPHEAGQWSAVADRIGELAVDAHAIGECGLDWYRNLAPREEQIVAFVGQIEMARELGKPIIIHCRDAFRDVYELLEKAQMGETAVLHCWTGGSKWTKRFNELGVTFSLAGPVTYKTGHTLQHAARFLPRDRTMIETDSPYLTPEPARSESGHMSNEPANVVHTGAVLAGIWDVPVEEVAVATTATAGRVFGDPRG